MTCSSGGSYPYSLATGDLNGDGLADIVVANMGVGNASNVGVLINALAPPFFSADGTFFDVQPRGFMAGQLVQGTNNAFDGLNRLQVGGVDYAPVAGPLNLDDGSQTLVLPQQTMAGLNVSREVTVPSAGSQDFARTVEVLTNATDSDIRTTVRILGNLGSDAATTVFDTSDGDANVEATDQWIGTDDADGSGSPAIIQYIHGPLGLQPTSVVRTGDNIEWTYNVTVPAMRTVRLATLTIVATTRAQAETAAGALVNSFGFGGQAAEFLSSDELRSLANFAFYTSPTINGLLNDTNFGWDGVTNDPTLDMSGLVSGDTVEYRFSTSGDGGTYGAWGGNNPPQGAVAVEVRQRDGAGNVSAASAPFDFAFDSVAPTVIGVRVTLTTVTDAEVTPRPQDEEVVVVTYDSHLDWAYGRAPALGFTQPVLTDGVDGGPATFTLDPNNSTWIDNSDTRAIYQFAYTLTDNGVDYPHVGVVTQPGTTHDVAGNEPVTHTGTDDFAVNTATAPARIVDAYSNLSLVSGRNAAEAQPRFYVRLDYDQAMAYWPKPVVTFTPDASSTLVYDDADSFWLDNPPTAFWAQFDVASTGMPFTGEAITVSGAQDLANRADQARYVGAETVAIDMVDPPPPLATVSNIEISTPLVTDAATEPGVEEFYVRVIYNQTMSLTASPTIDFSQPLLSDGGAAGVGTFELDRSRSTWQDQSHYIAWYKVTDQNVKYDSPIQVERLGGVGPARRLPGALHQPAAVHRGHEGPRRRRRRA